MSMAESILGCPTGGALTPVWGCHCDDTLPYQLAGSFWRRFKATPAASDKQAMSIQVAYSRTRLAVNDTIKCKVTVTNNTSAPINMAIVDLGIPPGFVVDPAGFARAVRARVLAKYELTGNHYILYTRRIGTKAPLRLSYALRAKYPVRAKTPPARVYEYYRPENQAKAPGSEIVVDAK